MKNIDREKWTTGDWLLLCFPLITAVWGGFFVEATGMVNIWGMKVETQFVVAAIPPLIAAIALLTGILLKEFFHNRNQYKKILKRLGEFKDISLEQQLGVGVKNDSIMSISKQIGTADKSITKQLGVVNKSLTEQIGVGNDDKSISKQLSDLFSLVSFVYEHTKKEENTRRAPESNEADRENLNACLDIIKTFAVEQAEICERIKSLSIELDEVRQENTLLREENAKLRSEYSEEYEEEQALEFQQM